MPNPNNNSVQDKFITLENLERYNDYVYPDEMSWDEYQEIEPEAGKTYFITDYDAGQSAEAVDVSYDNISSELQANDVQDAIDELKDLVDNIEDNNTTYTLSVGTGANENKIVLTPSTGNPDVITVPYATSAGDANTVSNHTVASDVPANAVFTDTTYTDATTSASGLMSSTDKTKLDGIATGAEVNVQADWDETSSSSDAYIQNKPTLGTAAAKDVPATGNASTSQVVMGDDTRLSDARPASDVSSWAKAATKPSYTANEVGAIASTEKGANSGVAELDSNGKVPSAQLPSFVDDTVEGYLYNGHWYSDAEHQTEVVGESGKIYVELSTNKTYRWTGTIFVEISESLALGETSSTAYAGNKGKANADAIAAIKDGTDIDSFGDVEGAISTLQSNFQDGVDSVYNAVVAKGSTPASKSLSDVVTGIANIPNANSGTYTASSRAAAIDMGQANTYRYVNTNGVPNSNSGTYDVTSNGVKDMGSDNTERYINVAVPNTNAATYDVTSNGIKDMGATNDKRYVNVNVPNSNSGTQSITANGITDMGAANTQRYVNVNVPHPTHTETYTPTSRASNLDMGATNLYRYVNTNSVPNSNSGTQSISANGITDMGATNDKRYVNVSVANSNSGTYTYASGSTGGTVDMGATNSYRYVNATNVYNKGKADGVTTHTTTYTPTSRASNNDMGATHTYRYVNTNSVPNTNSGTYTPAGSSIYDMGATNTYRYCDSRTAYTAGYNAKKAELTNTYTPTSRASNLDMGANHTYRYVNTNSVPNSNSGTYGSVTSNGVKDMGATNSYRYCNINVPNSNSGTYTYASGSTGGTVDMGATNSYRYVNATNVYNKGKADGKGEVSFSWVDGKAYSSSSGISISSCTPNTRYLINMVAPLTNYYIQSVTNLSSVIDIYKSTTVSSYPYAVYPPVRSVIVSFLVTTSSTATSFVISTSTSLDSQNVLKLD